MGCSPPLARNGSPGVLAGSNRPMTEMEREREGTGGGTGMQAQGGRGEEGRSQSGGEVGTASG